MLVMIRQATSVIENKITEKLQRKELKHQELQEELERIEESHERQVQEIEVWKTVEQHPSCSSCYALAGLFCLLREGQYQHSPLGNISTIKTAFEWDTAVGGLETWSRSFSRILRLTIDVCVFETAVQLLMQSTPQVHHPLFALTSCSSSICLSVPISICAYLSLCQIISAISHRPSLSSKAPLTSLSPSPTSSRSKSISSGQSHVSLVTCWNSTLSDEPGESWATGRDGERECVDTSRH
jgi:hypothetical protein